MSTTKPRKGAPAGPALLADFHPLPILWERAPPLCPSEQSARWSLRQHRAALIEAKALAMLRGRLLVHPQRFAEVLERQAIAAVRESVKA